MRKSIALVVAFSLASVTTAALAADQDTLSSCMAARKQVETALAGQQNDAARAEQKAGLEFCNSGLYHQGMAHYAKALELAGNKS